jgi:hypothetical protein
MIDDKEVIDEGFKPLKKTATEPQPLPSKPFLDRGMSFNVSHLSAPLRTSPHLSAPACPSTQLN